MNFILEDAILNQTQYKSGYDNKEDKYVLSASMVGNPTLQNYLSIVNDNSFESAIADTTLGTIFHKGMEVIIKDEEEVENKGAVSELSMFFELKNGWIISGTADLVHYDLEDSIAIRDYKLTKSYALKKMKENLNGHQYAKQLQTLEFLYKKTMRSDITINLFCDVFIKDAKAIEYEKTYTAVQIPNKSIEASEEDLLRQTTQLQEAIESGTIPDMCPDVWVRKIKGVTIPTKCAFWCSHGKAGTCPYYNPRTRTNAERLLNW